MPSFASNVRVGTAVAPNNTSQRGAPMAVLVVKQWTNAAAADADGHIVAQDMTAAGSLTTFPGALAGVHDYARNVVCDASGASTGTVTITGKDQYGNTVTEAITLNGTTAVPGAVAFKSITSIAWTATAGVNLTVGSGDVLGLDYKCAVGGDLTSGMVAEGVDGGAVSGGTLVQAKTTANTDRRGTYAPNVNDLADGAKDHTVVYLCTDFDTLT